MIKKIKIHKLIKNLEKSLNAICKHVGYSLSDLKFNPGYDFTCLLNYYSLKWRWKSLNEIAIYDEDITKEKTEHLFEVEDGKKENIILKGRRLLLVNVKDKFKNYQNGLYIIIDREKEIK